MGTVVLAAFPASLAGAALHCTAPAPQSVLAGPRRLVLLALDCAGKQGAPAAWCGLWWSLPADPNPWLALHEVVVGCPTRQASLRLQLMHKPGIGTLRQSSDADPAKGDPENG